MKYVVILSSLVVPQTLLFGIRRYCSRGTVSIFYSEGCAGNLTVFVTDSSGKTDTFQVPPENTISRTYSDLVMARLTCPLGTGNNSCLGKYSSC